MEELLEKNIKLINKWQLSDALKLKKYNLAASISALEITNHIAKESINGDMDPIIRLYALLQALFVGIDSLYALALGVTKNKNFININNNKTLRELRYIRNDVVGHPANRVLDSDKLAYCILNSNAITNTEFSYTIYSVDSIIEKNVSINEIVYAYLDESNKLLESLLNISLEYRTNKILEEYIVSAIEAYIYGKDYASILKDFVAKYKELFPNSENHRILWRYQIINKLEDFPDKELARYCILIELKKMYTLLSGKKYELFKEPKPECIRDLYRFLNKNKDLYPNLLHLTNTSDPLFKQSLNNLIRKCKNNNVLSYLYTLSSLFQKNDMDLLYALALPIKEYKIK